MNLGLAGAISGMGQQLGQGLQTLNSGIVQMGVQQSLAKNDKEFQMEKLRIQMEHESQMADRKIAGDKENTLAQIKAQGENQLANTREHNAGAKEVAGMQIEGADKRSDKEIGSREKVDFAKLDLTKKMHDEDLKAAEARYKTQFSLEERKIALDKGKVMTVATGDGRIALLSPDGKAKGYLTDGKGNEIKAPADLPKSTQLQIGSIMDEMHDMSREYAKQLVHTPEQEDVYKAQKKRMHDSINELIAEATGKPIAKPNATPAPLNLGKYQSNQFPLTIPGGKTQPGPQIPYRPGMAPGDAPSQKPKGIRGIIENTPSWQQLLQGK